jgi:hypothetical protein
MLSETTNAEFNLFIEQMDSITVVLCRPLNNWNSHSDPGNHIVFYCIQKFRSKILYAEWKNLNLLEIDLELSKCSDVLQFSIWRVSKSDNLFDSDLDLRGREYLTGPRIASYYSSPRTRICTSCTLLACKELYCTLFHKSFRFSSQLSAQHHTTTPVKKFCRNVLPK